jgi:hypothetical protein
VRLLDVAIRHELDAVAPALTAMQVAVNANNLTQKNHSTRAGSCCSWRSGQTVTGSVRRR